MNARLRYWMLFLLFGAGLWACSDNGDFAGYPDDGIPGASLVPAVRHVRLGFADTLEQAVKSDGRVELGVVLSESSPDTLRLKVRVAETRNCAPGRDFTVEEECTVPAGETRGSLVLDIVDDRKPGEEMSVLLELESFVRDSIHYDFDRSKACRVSIGSNSILFFQQVEYTVWEAEHVRPSALEIPLRMAGNLDGEAEISFAVKGMGETDGMHWELENSTLLVKPGESLPVLRMFTVDDEEVNEDRVAEISITGIRGGNLIPARDNVRCRVRVRSEEVAKVVAMDLPEYTVDEDVEGGILEIPLSLDIPAERPVRVRLEALAGTAEEGVDFRLLTPELVFEPGSTAVRAKIAVTDDRKLTGRRGFMLKIAAVEGANALPSATAAGCTVVIREDDYDLVALKRKAVTYIEARAALLDLRIDLEEEYAESLQLDIRLAGNTPALASLVTGQVSVEEDARQSGTVRIRVDLDPDVEPAAYGLEVVAVNGQMLEAPVRVMDITPLASPYRKMLGNWELTCTPDNCPAVAPVRVTAGATREERLANWGNKLVCVAEKFMEKKFDITFYIQWNNGSPWLMLLEKAYPGTLGFGPGMDNGTVRLTWGGDTQRRFNRHNLGWNEEDGLLDWHEGSSVGGGIYQNDGHDVNGWWWFMKGTKMRKQD